MKTNFKINNMKNLRITLIVLLITFLFTSCADISPHVETCITSDAYGFWGGLWHGMIAPFAWIGSLFVDDIAIYAVNNNGAWYDFGFVLGIGALSSGTTKAVD